MDLSWKDNAGQPEVHGGHPNQMISRFFLHGHLQAARCTSRPSVGQLVRRMYSVDEKKPGFQPELGFDYLEIDRRPRQPSPEEVARNATRKPLSRAADDVMVPDFGNLADPPFPESEAVETKRARLLYMSRKRGILESDLLLSTFALKYIKNFTPEQLIEFDLLMKENDWDIYYWATGARPVPDDVMAYSIMPTLIEHSLNKDKKIVRMPDLDGKIDLEK